MESWMLELKKENDIWNKENMESLPIGLKQEYSRLFSLLEDKKLFGAFLQIKDLYEILIKIPTLSFLAYEFQKKEIEKGDWLFKFFEKDLSFGDWNTIAKYYSNDVLNEDIKEYLKKWTKLIEGKQVIKWRNDWIGHGALAQEDNAEFNISLSEKVRELICFIKDNFEIIKKCVILESNDSYKVEFDQKSIILSPWIIYKNEKTYFFDSYKEKKKKVCYLDYENGDKIELVNLEIEEFIENLQAQNGARLFTKDNEKKIILLNEENLIKTLKKSEDYTRPEFLCSSIEDFMNTDGGIMLLQMEEGFGKTSFSYALDENGQAKIKIKDCLVRTYYINDTYASNIDYFAITMSDIFRMDSDGKLLFRGMVPLFDFHSTDKENILVNLLEFYKNNTQKSKILLVLDGLDEICKQDNGSILDFLPDRKEIPKDVYIICTCRTDKELIDTSDLFIKIHNLHFTKRIVITKDNKEYNDLIKKYITKKIGIKDDILCQKIMDVGDFQFRKVDYICRHIKETGELDIDYDILTEWNFGYLKRMFGEKYFQIFIKFFEYMMIVNKPITIDQLCIGCTGQNTTMQDIYFLWYLKDMIQIDRNSGGNRISIKNESVSSWMMSEYNDKFAEDAKSIIDNYIKDDIENEVIISQCIANIVKFLKYPIETTKARKILERIKYNIDRIDATLVNNSLDLILIHQSGQEVAKLSDLNDIETYLFEDDSIQAELYEMYGMVGASEHKYHKCLFDNSVIDRIDENVVTVVLIKYTILLDKLKKYQEAIEILDKIIFSSKKIKDSILGIAYSNRGQMYCKCEKYDIALTDLEKAIEILGSELITQTDYYQLSLCYLNKSTIEYNLNGNYENAIFDAKCAIELTTKVESRDNKVNRARAWLNYSFISFKSGKNIEEAITLTDDAIELLNDLYNKDELFDIDVLVTAYCNKGIMLNGQKNDEAKEYFEKSAILSESLMLQDRCYSVYDLFKPYHLLLEYDKAYLKRIFDLLLNIDDKADVNCNWVFIAIYDLVVNEYKLDKIVDITIAWLELSLTHEIFLSNDTLDCITGIGIGLSEFLRLSHKYDQGCNLLIKIIEAKESHGIRDQINTSFLKEIGFFFIKQNKISDGIKYYLRSIEEFDSYYRTGNIEEIGDFIMVCANLGFVYYSFNQMRKAHNIWLRSLLLMKEQLEKGKEVDHDILKKVSQGLLLIERTNIKE